MKFYCAECKYFSQSLPYLKFSSKFLKIKVLKKSFIRWKIQVVLGFRAYCESYNSHRPSRSTIKRQTGTDHVRIDWEHYNLYENDYLDLIKVFLTSNLDFFRVAFLGRGQTSNINLFQEIMKEFWFRWC